MYPESCVWHKRYVSVHTNLQHHPISRTVGSEPGIFPKVCAMPALAPSPPPPHVHKSVMCSGVTCLWSCKKRQERQVRLPRNVAFLSVRECHVLGRNSERVVGMLEWHPV